MAERLRVHVVVEHSRMRAFLTHLLTRDYECQVTGGGPGPPVMADADLRMGDVLLIDQSLFARGAWREPAAAAGARVVVIGPEDDCSTRDAAAALGADAWLAREQLGEQLGQALLRALEPRPRRTTEGVT